MCGIAGILATESLKTELSITIDAMLDAQKHRGPDYVGRFVDSSNGIALGHNRLSIIDTSESAHQPFFSASKRFAIVFNGEIYNYLELKKELEGFGYSFRTHSDTEVLLTAYEKWGTECLSRLNGMFSFALWDSATKELFAARDRFGVKPFFYSNTKDAFVFASEIKALFASSYVEKIPCAKAWSGYLSAGTYATPQTTFWKNVLQLEPGCYLTFKNKRLVQTRWYDFPKRISEVAIPPTYEAARELLWEKLRQSVVLRLRSDVPIGLTLSGGIDSSALSVLVAEHAGIAKKAFTFFCDDPRYDELEWAAPIVAHGALPWIKVKVSAEEIPTYALSMQHQQDEPYGGIATLAYAHAFKAARKEGIIVLLDGGGMDEQLAGYSYYGSSNQSIVQGTTQSPIRPNCLDPLFSNYCQPAETIPTPFKDLIQNQQFRDLFYTKLPRDLRFNDRISMTYGTELREPFLNHELVEFAFALPQEYKIRNDKRKELVRDSLRRALKAALVDAPKRPVQTPQREWLRVPLKEWVTDSVAAAISCCPILRKNEVENELNQFFAGHYDNSFFIWQWITLAMMKPQF